MVGKYIEVGVGGHQDATWRDFFEISYLKGACKCKFFALSLFYVSFFHKECVEQEFDA